MMKTTICSLSNYCREVLGQGFLVVVDDAEDDGEVLEKFALHYPSSLMFDR